MQHRGENDVATTCGFSVYDELNVLKVIIHRQRKSVRYYSPSERNRNGGGADGILITFEADATAGDVFGDVTIRASSPNRTFARVTDVWYSWHVCDKISPWIKAQGCRLRIDNLVKDAILFTSSRRNIRAKAVVRYTIYTSDVGEGRLLRKRFWEMGVCGEIVTDLQELRDRASLMLIRPPVILASTVTDTDIGTVIASKLDKGYAFYLDDDEVYRVAPEILEHRHNIKHLTPADIRHVLLIAVDVVGARRVMPRGWATPRLFNVLRYIFPPVRRYHGNLWRQLVQYLLEPDAYAVDARMARSALSYSILCMVQDCVGHNIFESGMNSLLSQESSSSLYENIVPGALESHISKVLTFCLVKHMLVRDWAFLVAIAGNVSTQCTLGMSNMILKVLRQLKPSSHGDYWWQCLMCRRVTLLVSLLGGEVRFIEEDGTSDSRPVAVQAPSMTASGRNARFNNLRVEFTSSRNPVYDLWKQHAREELIVGEKRPRGVRSHPDEFYRKRYIADVMEEWLRIVKSFQYCHDTRGWIKQSIPKRPSLEWIKETSRYWAVKTLEETTPVVYAWYSLATRVNLLQLVD